MIGKLAGAAVTAHAAPYLLTLGAYDPVRLGLLRKARPSLYGVGRPGHVALTFDDGPDAHGTQAILDQLDEFGWKATFFMLGEMAHRNPHVAKDVVARGHEVGLHGYAHESYMRMHLGAAIEDMTRAREVVEDITGQPITYFRPPYGTLSSPALLAARMQGLQTVLWTAWGRDWEADTTAVRIAANITTGILDGGTILLHDSDCTSSSDSWQRTLGALPLLHELLKHDGLNAGPLREHF